jgi:putative tricarboxylic transport membrane protein
MADLIGSFFGGFNQIFTGSTFFLMILGIAIGFVVGILPGLGGPTTIALMLPFIIKMNPFEAFAFLLGMLAVTATTGDITSILFGVPGEPTTAATIVDGHPMAKKGEAGRALGAALMSSLVGAVFGAFALALAVPMVKPLVRLFGSPELFTIAILGLTFVVSLSGESVLRGFIVGGTGLFLSTIGLNMLTGIQRYTFGLEFLWDGVGLVPVTIGLFAFPEIIDLAVRGTSIAEQGVGGLGGVLEGVKDTFRHWKLVLRCSAIGAYTAVIPGIGGAATQWMAYAHAVQSSGEKERFGKGAVEGVLAPGAANNSTLGGSLITTVAFGIPPSVSMAILMGAFLIQGIVPGPDMLLPEAKGGHLALTFSFVWINVVSNIITVAICLLFLKQLAKVTLIRGSLVIPFILLLIYLGAFAEKNTFEDIIIVIFFGILGWVLERIRWPRAPLVLGLVLGPLAENRLFLSVDNYGLSWVMRPTVMVLIGLIVVGIVYPVLKAKWEKKKKRGIQVVTQNKADQDGQKGSLINLATLFGFFIVGVYAWALWESRLFRIRVGLFPWVIGFPVLVLAIVHLVMLLMRRESIDAGIEELPKALVNRRTGSIFIWIIGFSVAIWLLGFNVASPFCTFLYLLIGREKWSINLIATGAAWAFVYGFFYRIMNVPFPPGLLFQ